MMKDDRKVPVLESEETGFSAVEEEVRSNFLKQRPTVYAGMSKFETSEEISLTG